MTNTLIKAHLTQPPTGYENIHNRWHPDIPMVCQVNPGGDFILEASDWTGGFSKKNDSADDVCDIDLTTVHRLSVPEGVTGAEPGDLLVVDLLDIDAKQGSLWGFNGFFAKKNGGTYLTEHFPEAQKSAWDFKSMFTSSRQIPGVNFAGLIHPGLIGCLPDKKLLDRWNTREQPLIDTHPTGSPANLPSVGTAHMGRLTGEAKAKAAAEHAHTVPPREHGGNCDIKDLSCGSKVFLRASVDGAGLSVGDLHFSQGDGQITCCGAIQMAGCLRTKVAFIKRGMAECGMKKPIFKPSVAAPNYKDFSIFEGISVDECGEQYCLDVKVACRQAGLNAIEYLKKFGHSGARVYSILGTAPVQCPISRGVDGLNSCATLRLPTEIFDLDINPNASGPTQFVASSIDLPLLHDID